MSMSLAKGTLEKYLNPVFVETGTFDGKGVKLAKEVGFLAAHTIELDNNRYNISKKNLADVQGVTLYEGDTVDILPGIVSRLTERATLWIDAHPVGERDICKIGKFRHPLIQELKLIAEHSLRRDHTIMADDRHDFRIYKTTDEEVMNAIKAINPRYHVKIDGDIVVGEIHSSDYVTLETEAIRGLVHKVAPQGKWLVDVGANDGFHRSNVIEMVKAGWNAVLIEADPKKFEELKVNMAPYPNAITVHRRVGLEPENTLNRILEWASVPEDFDLLNIDIDGNDYWVWESLNFKPKVVSIEYNSHFKLEEKKGIKYDPKVIWDGDSYYGASAGALVSLAGRKDYTLADCVPGANLFFVRGDLAVGLLPLLPGKLDQTPIHKLTQKEFVDLP